MTFSNESLDLKNKAFMKSMVNNIYNTMQNFNKSTQC